MAKKLSEIVLDMNAQAKLLRETTMEALEYQEDADKDLIMMITSLLDLVDGLQQLISTLQANNMYLMDELGLEEPNV